MPRKKHSLTLFEDFGRISETSVLIDEIVEITTSDEDRLSEQQKIYEMHSELQMPMGWKRWEIFQQLYCAFLMANLAEEAHFSLKIETYSMLNLWRF